MKEMKKVYVQNLREMDAFVANNCGRTMQMDIDKDGLYFQILTDDDILKSAEKICEDRITRKKRQEKKWKEEREREREECIRMEKDPNYRPKSILQAAREEYEERFGEGSWDK